MSQLSFDGFVEENPEKNKPEKPLKESWYKGRTLSHSSMNMYKTCPQRWKFRYVDKIPEKPRSYFSFGKSVHTGLEHLFSVLDGPLTPLNAVLAYYKEKWISEGYDTPAQEKWFFQEGERILKGYYAKHASDQKNVFKVEFRFTIDMDGVPVTGFVDRIDKTPSGGLLILDYKTGKAFDKARVRNDPQLTLYQIAVKQVFSKNVDTVALYHLNSLTPLTAPAHSKKQEDDVRGVVLDVAKGVQDQKFDPKPDERGHCQYCDYMQICPAFSGKKFSNQLKQSKQTMVDKVDRFGKLDMKITELLKERDELGDDISSQIRSTGENAIKGELFEVRMEPGTETQPPSLSATPLKENPV